MFAGSALAGLSSVPAAAQDNAACNGVRNPLLWAMAYKQTVAEFHALCHQAYNLARMRIDQITARRKIEETHEVALILGDNLNDYRRDYYVKGVDERMALMERDRDDWGTKFILIPNPTDGHWVRAIFGDSEPTPTDENRQLLKDAATRVAWDGTS
jgi:predicted secreted acid phosphatase